SCSIVSPGGVVVRGVSLLPDRFRAGGATPTPATGGNTAKHGAAPEPGNTAPNRGGPPPLRNGAYLDAPPPLAPVAPQARWLDRFGRRVLRATRAGAHGFRESRHLGSRAASEPGRTARGRPGEPDRSSADPAGLTSTSRDGPAGGAPAQVLLCCSMYLTAS